jgi:hypothetical protein
MHFFFLIYRSIKNWILNLILIFTDNNRNFFKKITKLEKNKIYLMTNLIFVLTKIYHLDL